MPTVPTYGAQRAGVEVTGPGSVLQRGAPAGVPGVIQQRAPSASTFGVAERNEGAIGQAAANLGNAFTQIAEQARKVRAEENLVEFQRARNEVLMNPETGYYNTRGRDAYEGRDATIENLQKMSRQRADAIQDPVAREMFTTAANSLLMQDEQQTMEFAARNFDAWQKAVSQQRVEVSLNDAMRNWRNPEQLAIDFELGKQSIMDANQGMGTEYINAEINQYAGSFYRGVVEAAINSSVSEGEAMMAEFKGHLDANVEAQLRDRLDNKKEVEESQFYASTAVIKATNLVNDYYRDPDARNIIIDEINKIEDPKLRDLTMSQAMSDLNQRMNAQSEQRAAYYEQAVGLMNSGMTTAQIMAQQPEVWNTMTSTQQAALMNAEVAGPVKTDLDLWTGLTLASDQELETITNEELSVIQTKLAPADYKQLVDRIKDLRAGTEETRIGWTRNAQAAAAMKEVFGDSKGDVELAEQRVFYGTLQAEYNARKEALGRELNYEETDKLYSDLTARYLVQRKWLGIPMGKTEYGLEDVPLPAVQEISAILREQGLSVDAPSIVQFYLDNKDKF